MWPVAWGEGVAASTGRTPPVCLPAATRWLTPARPQALFHGATKEDLAGKGWVVAQQKAFTKWMNVYLRTRKLRVDSIFTGLKDGVMLINLLEGRARARGGGIC